jgi:hypothetical protein
MSLVITAVVMLVGSAVAVGQSDRSPDPLASGTVSIAVTAVGLVSPGLMKPDDARAVYHEEGRQSRMTWEASDGRLSGEVTCAGSRHINRDGSFVETETYAVENDGGRWVGQSTGLGVTAPVSDSVIGNGPLLSGPGHQDRVLLRGEGSYEGLSALVDVDWAHQPPLVIGTIFRGEMPPTPGSGSGG